jgi:hypothetical protein
MFLGLTLAAISSISYASSGAITFSGQITVPVCSTSYSAQHERVEISNCKGSANSKDDNLFILLSDIDKLVEKHPSKASVLEDIEKLANKHNVTINISSINKEATTKNNYIIAFEYH